MGRHRVPDETLDTFGNWALVSCGINSEYGNKPFDEKCAHFLNHNRKCIDSLKMATVAMIEDVICDCYSSGTLTPVYGLQDGRIIISHPSRT